LKRVSITQQLTKRSTLPPGAFTKATAAPTPLPLLSSTPISFIQVSSSHAVSKYPVVVGRGRVWDQPGAAGTQSYGPVLEGKHRDGFLHFESGQQDGWSPPRRVQKEHPRGAKIYPVRGKGSSQGLVHICVSLHPAPGFVPMGFASSGPSLLTPSPNQGGMQTAKKFC